MNKKTFKSLVILNAFTSCHCTITYMALSMALSYIFSNSILVFTFYSGLYLMSMGIGALLIEKISFKNPNLVKLIFHNSLGGILLASPGVLAVLLINEFLQLILRKYQIDLVFCMFPLGILLTILIGIVSGAELPLFSKLIEKENLPKSKPIISVLSSDYFGAFVGIFIFTFILNPFLGLINAITFSQALTLFVINIVYFALNLPRLKAKTFYLILLFDIYVYISYRMKNPIIDFLDGLSSF